MGGISRAVKKKRLILKRANERKRQQALLRKAAQAAGGNLGVNIGQGQIKVCREDDEGDPNYFGEPVRISVKQEIDEQDDKVDEDQSEDPDWTPTAPPSSSSPCQRENFTTSGYPTSHLTSVVTNCLLCHRSRKCLDWKPSNNRSLSEANFQVYFILRKMLNVPKCKLINYLVNYGDPRQWIETCRDCLAIVEKAVKLQRDITKLEEKLKECQEEMRERIRRTIKVNEGNSLIGGDVNRVTRETREMVGGNREPSDLEIIKKNKINQSGGQDQKSFDVAILSGEGATGSSGHSVKLVNCQFEEYPEEEEEDKQPEVERISQLISNSYPSDGDGEDETESEVESGSDDGSSSNSLYEEPISGPCDNDQDNRDDKINSEDDSSLKNYQIIITSEVAPSINQSQPWKLLSNDYECFKEGAYRCQICDNDKHTEAGAAGIGNMSLEKFASHIIFHKKRPFKCTECGNHFANLEEVKKTNRLCANSSGNNHTCSTDTVILEINEKFDPSKIWQCHGHGCLSKFNFEDNRDNHQETCENCKNSSEIEKKFHCQICAEDKGTPTNKKSFTNLTEWTLHRCLSHPDKAAQSCLYCNQIFSIKTKEGIDLPNYYALRVHMQRNHRAASLRRSPDVCDYCGGVFLNAVELHEHLHKLHNFAKSAAYQCEICYLRKSHRCDVRKHVDLMHNLNRSNLAPGGGDEGEQLICDLCGHKNLRKYLKSFLDHKLTEHGIMPEGEGEEDDKGYQWKISGCDKEGCGFKSLFERKVRIHGMKVHGGERKFKCAFCGKGFLNSCKLREHEEIHRNKSVKPYQCEICGNRFAVKNYLYIHTRLSHQNRPFASTNKKRTRKLKS